MPSQIAISIDTPIQQPQFHAASGFSEQRGLLLSRQRLYRAARDSVRGEGEVLIGYGAARVSKRLADKPHRLLTRAAPLLTLFTQ